MTMIRKKPSTGRQKSFPLDHSIDELENLIAEKSRIDRNDIPVLDEVIDPDLLDEAAFSEPFIEWPEEADAGTADTGEPGLSEEQIEMLVGKMDQRIAGELDELVGLLKGAIRETILTEIKTRLENRTGEKPASGDDPHKDNQPDPPY